MSERNSRLGIDSYGKRLNLVLPEQTMERIAKLKHVTAASSVTDVIRTAILTYEALVEFIADGNKFYIKKGGADQFMPIEFLFDVRRNAPAGEGAAQPVGR